MTEISQELTSLATSGAAALVQAMTTDLWSTVRDRVAALFGGDQGVAAELDQTRSDVLEKTLPNEDARTEWRNRLRRLLRNNPEAAAELRVILNELKYEEPASSQVTNQIYGNVTGTAFQGHTFYGGIVYRGGPSDGSGSVSHSQ